MKPLHNPRKPPPPNTSYTQFSHNQPSPKTPLKESSITSCGHQSNTYTRRDLNHDRRNTHITLYTISPRLRSQPLKAAEKNHPFLQASTHLALAAWFQVLFRPSALAVCLLLLPAVSNSGRAPSCVGSDAGKWVPHIGIPSHPQSRRPRAAPPQSRNQPRVLWSEEVDKGTQTLQNCMWPTK